MLRKVSFLLVLFLFCFLQITLAEEADKTKVEQNNQKAKIFKSEAEELEKSLNLTPEQKTKISEIRSKAKSEIQLIAQEANLKVREIRVKANNEIEALLTPEQKEKTMQFRQKFMVPKAPAVNPAN
jgi:Spy/CpxP family protein refolding chaperone